MSWIIGNWEYVLAVFYGLEKIVKVTPVKWDDILVDGAKTVLTGFKSQKTTLK